MKCGFSIGFSMVRRPNRVPRKSASNVGVGRYPMDGIYCALCERAGHLAVRHNKGRPYIARPYQVL